MSRATLTKSESVLFKTVTLGVDSMGSPTRTPNAGTAYPMKITQLSASEIEAFSTASARVSAKAYYAGDFRDNVADVSIDQSLISTSNHKYRVQGHTFDTHPSGVVKMTVFMLEQIQGDTF